MDPRASLTPAACETSSVKIRPMRQDDGSWAFVEKWILREAVKPFITEELVSGCSRSAFPALSLIQTRSAVPAQEGNVHRPAPGKV